MSKYTARCPICNTSDYLTYDMGSHAESSSGGQLGCESYFCDKCGGEFNISYEINDNKIRHMKLNYSLERSPRAVTRA